jgi:hypothetical protein
MFQDYCHNELVKTLDLHETGKIKITFWQSLFKQLGDLNPSILEKIGDKTHSQILCLQKSACFNRDAKPKPVDLRLPGIKFEDAVKQMISDSQSPKPDRKKPVKKAPLKR